MAKTFDPYAQWLGIRKKRQAPNYYELLGLARYCDDPEAIQTAADQRLLLIGGHLQGPQAHWAGRLLEELTAGADTLAAGDLGCLMNMAGRLKREGSPIRTYHIAEILAGPETAPAGTSPGIAEPDRR